MHPQFQPAYPCGRFLQRPLNRREMLRQAASGFGGIALLGLLSDRAFGKVLASDGPPMLNSLAPRAPHFAPKARSVIFLYMDGGPSQVDTFDPKPKLDEYNGKPIPSGNLRTERKTGNLLKSPFTFKKYGQSGIEVSEIFPKLGA